MCCTRLAENTGRKNYAKNRHLRTIAQLCTAISSQVRHISTIGKKTFKQQSLLHMSSQYGELRPTNGWDLLASLGHPSKSQPVSRLGFVTAPMSLNGGQENFAGCLAVSWAGTLHIHFGGCCPLTEFCRLQNSLCVQVLHSPILAALLHGTRVAAVSQTLWCVQRMELRNFHRGRHLHRESKKGATLTMAITLSILDRFAKFFHCCKEQ